MSVLTAIPWDLVARGVAATVQVIRRARDMRQATDLVVALERIARVPTVDIDRIVERVMRLQPIDGGPLDGGD